MGRSLRLVENRKTKIIPFALIGSCFSDSEFQSLAPYGVDENENENSDDDSVLVASLAATFRTNKFILFIDGVEFKMHFCYQRFCFRLSGYIKGHPGFKYATPTSSLVSLIRP